MAGHSETDLWHANFGRVTAAIQQASASTEVQNLPQIVAVSKKQSAEKIRFFYELGLRHFGENYIQEAREKMELLADLDIQWHFIGTIQKKKANSLVGAFAWIHSVDRLDIAERLNSKAGELGLQQKILVQVNVVGEASKGGVSPKELPDFLQSLAALPNLVPRGLMVFPPLRDDPEDNRPWFLHGRRLLAEGQAVIGPTFDRLSMGTSSDFAIAAECGSHFVRIGQALLGERP